MSIKIPILDLKPAVDELRADLDAAYRRVMDSGWFLLGKELDAFEREYAASVGVKHCVGVANGLEALQLVLMALGVYRSKPDDELLSREGNPFWVHAPTLAHIKKLLFATAYPAWLWNTVLISVVATFLSIFCSVLAAYAIERLRFRGSRYVGMSIFLAYLVPPSILFIPLATMVYRLNLFDTGSR
jgi:ABC-type sugar transport system permease subunit